MDFKSLAMGAAVASVGIGMVTIPMIGDDYEKDAEKVVITPLVQEEAKKIISKKTGEVEAIVPVEAEYGKDFTVIDEKTKENIPLEDLEIVIVPKTVIPPPLVKKNSHNGKPIVLFPGKKYTVSLKVDNKIFYEVEYTPNKEEYPQDYAYAWIGVLKFDIRTDIISDQELADSLFEALGNYLIVDTIKSVDCKEDKTTCDTIITTKRHWTKNNNEKPMSMVINYE